MSFQPLPDILNRILAAVRGDPGFMALDLGCGAGHIRSMLREYSVAVYGVDHVGPALGNDPDLLADLTQLPVRSHSVDLLVAGNVVRHLLSYDPTASFLDGWVSVLRPGGWLIILEDRPRAKHPAQQNYLDLQAFLGLLAPDQRGPLIPARQLLATPRFRDLAGSWQSGTSANSWPLAVDRVLEMLQAAKDAPNPELRRLIDAIEVDGMAYTDYWWAGWKKSSE